MRIRAEKQHNPVADEVSALIAVVRPILIGVLFSLKDDVVAEFGGHEQIKLKLLNRLRRPGDGDCGICFEYAVHDALRRDNSMVLERVDDALSTLCSLPGQNLDSILFAAEKSGSEQLIDTARELVTPESILMSGARGRPVKLQRHIEGIAQAFRRPAARDALPYSISGVWKADLFVGRPDEERWVATTVKINADHLEGARGLRVGIVPVKQGSSDRPYKDDRRNLVVCPLLHDGSFMEMFYEGWIIVQAFLSADSRMPKEVSLPQPSARYVAGLLAERRDFPVFEVVEALAPFAQPELLETSEQTADLILTRGEDTEIRSVLAPQATQLTFEDIR